MKQRSGSINISPRLLKLSDQEEHQGKIEIHKRNSKLRGRWGSMHWTHWSSGPQESAQNHFPAKQRCATERGWPTKFWNEV